MSILDVVAKKHPVQQSSFRITDTGTEEALRRLAASDEKAQDTIILLAILEGSQSVLSLQRSKRLNTKRIERSLERLSRSGLISPVQRE